jgi:hypothetical protein
MRDDAAASEQPARCGSCEQQVPRRLGPAEARRRGESGLRGLNTGFRVVFEATCAYGVIPILFGFFVQFAEDGGCAVLDFDRTPFMGPPAVRVGGCCVVEG